MRERFDDSTLKQKLKLMAPAYALAFTVGISAGAVAEAAHDVAPLKVAHLSDSITTPEREISSETASCSGSLALLNSVECESSMELDLQIP